ncbi:hypothetical protein JW859_05785 [bacterium]|nr:hypothetical protein [bacterium]
MSTLNVPSFVPAINAARLVGVNNNLVAASLERLSSGLRINRAADDPAGLTISERLRGQRLGLARASLNAQDGVSLLQTADSSLTEITNALENIRELAVSASDGTKTASDRAAIQEEVTQYLAEIDRISASTEFNTKSLLTGTLGALASTSDYSSLRAVVTGDVGTGGSFVVRADVRNAGVLERQVSDVFTVTGSADLAGAISGLGTQQGLVTLATDQGGGVGNTGVDRYELLYSTTGETAVEGFISAGVNAKLSVTALGLASFAAGGVSFAELFEGENITAGDKIIFAVNLISTATNYSFAISAGRDIGAFITSVNTAFGAAGTVAGNDSGQISLNLAAGVQVTGVTFSDEDNSGSQLHISLNGTTGAIATNALHDGVSVTFTNNANTWSANLTKTAANQGMLSIGDASTGQLVIRFDPDSDFGSGGILSLTDTFTFSKTGGGNGFQDYGSVSLAGNAVAAGTVLLSATSQTTYALYAFDNNRYTSLVAAGVGQDLAVQMAKGARYHVDGAPATNTWTVGDYIEGEDLDDGTGTNPLTNLRLTLNGGILQEGETAVFDVSTSNTVRAGGTTTLASITAFSADGVFSGVSSRSLDVYLSDRSDKVTVQLTANDTLADVAGKLSLAIWNPDGTGLLGQDEIADAFAPPDLVRFNPVGSSRGTLSIVAPLPGRELIFAGDDELLDALDLAETVAAVNPVFSVSATNARTNQSVGHVVTDTNYASGLIAGVTLYFDTAQNLRLDPEPNAANTNTDFPYWTPDATPELSISTGDQAREHFVHVAPNPYQLQVGAATGHTLSMRIPTVTTETLGLTGLNVATQDRAGAAIGTVDEALSRIGMIQSRVGAYQNRLESTITQLDVAAENTLAAESRIRDVDYAQEILNLTRAQILATSSSYALVQANAQAASVLALLTA